VPIRRSVIGKRFCSGSVLRNLRSNEYETFDHALALVGVPQTPEAASFDPPQDAELRYAELAEDGTRQAIIGVRRDSMFYGAVAAHVGGRWPRIAAFSCWCKYESGDLLGGFIHIQVGPGVGQELVLRTSCNAAVELVFIPSQSLTPGTSSELSTRQSPL
jgi:hypothetical protein